ncbi:hypothetical protein F4861DRAFT_521319 [Xylaria intraflava]|nr:hypothetical protein F4861DRAFT_521319 [Xylaria intraflava]
MLNDSGRDAEVGEGPSLALRIKMNITLQSNTANTLQTTTENTSQGVEENPLPADNNDPLRDYPMQLMLLEQHRKKRRQMATASTENTARAVEENPLPARNNDPLQDYPMQLKLLEQQRKKRRLMTESSTKNTPRAVEESPLPERASNHSLQDYQFQLMLLERQRKKGSSMTETSTGSTPGTSTESTPQSVEESRLPERPSNHSLQDYQFQLMLLEQQRKKKLLMGGTRAGSTPGISTESTPQVVEENLLPGGSNYQSPPDHRRQMNSLEERSIKRPLLMAGTSANNIPQTSTGNVPQTSTEGRPRAVEESTLLEGNSHSSWRDDYHRQVNMFAELYERRRMMTRPGTSNATQNGIDNAPHGTDGITLRTNTGSAPQTERMPESPEQDPWPRHGHYSDPPQPYNLQLRLLEEISKKRILKARQELAEAERSGRTGQP